MSFLFQGLETVHLQGNTQLLSKLRGGLSLVSVEVGTGHTCIGSMLLPSSNMGTLERCAINIFQVFNFSLLIGCCKLFGAFSSKIVLFKMTILP